MIVPLRVEILAGGLRPVLDVIARIPQFRVHRPVRMFIDTGSPWSIISEKDAMIMQIPFNRVREITHMYGVGGASVEAYKLRRMTLDFRDVEGGLVHRELPVVYAIRTLKRDQSTITRSQALPSFLGVDFLVEHRFKLVFDPYNRLAHLEEVPSSIPSA